MILGRNLGISLPKNKKVTIKREREEEPLKQEDIFIA